MLIDLNCKDIIIVPYNTTIIEMKIETAQGEIISLPLPKKKIEKAIRKYSNGIVDGIIQYFKDEIEKLRE